MESPETLFEILSQLNQQGYRTDLNRQLSVLFSEPGAFEIHAVYRFEGATDPGDELILYALFSDKHALKGVFTNAYGVYADSVTAAIEHQLRFPPVDSDLQTGVRQAVTCFTAT